MGFCRGYCGLRRLVGCGLLVMLACWAQEWEPPSAHAAPLEAPPVVFVWDSPVGERTAEICRAALNQRGATVAAAILSPRSQPDSVLCLLLSTAGIRERFGSRLPDWGVGAALPGGRVIAIDYERQVAVGRSVEEVFLHELTHALVYQVVGQTWLPAWFQEGVAMWVSGEWRFVDTVNVVLNGSLPSLWQLQGPFPASAARADQAYRTSLLAIEAMRRWYGDDVITRLLATASSQDDFQTAFMAVTGQTDEEFEARFAKKMRLRFGWLFTLMRWPSLFVLMALIFAAGAVARIIRQRRRLAAMPDEPFGDDPS